MLTLRRSLLQQPVQPVRDHSAVQFDQRGAFELRDHKCLLMFIVCHKSSCFQFFFFIAHIQFIQLAVSHVAGQIVTFL